MSLNGAFADEHAVAAGHLSYPPALADFNDTEHTSADVGTPPVQPVAGSDFGHLYGHSPVMRALYDQIGKVSGTLVTMPTVGESGTDKELIARTAHDMNPRADQVFIAVNCGAVSPSLTESKLFGREEGSFMSASQRHIGYFEHARGDMILLGETAEIPVEMQVKLLRVLEIGVFMRVGGIEPIQTHARIVAATNHNLLETVSDGASREDLVYRLAVVPPRAPPLRGRGGDIEKLASYFLVQFNAAHQTNKVFPRQALATLRTQTWPGSVWELHNAVYRSYILDEKTVELATSLAQTRDPARPTMKEDVLSLSVGVTLADAQRAMIMAALEHFHGNRRQAVKALGVSLKMLYNCFDPYQSTAAAAMAA